MRALETDMPIDHVNRLGWTALLQAVILGRLAAGANVNLARPAGRHPGRARQRRGYGEIARLLQ